MPDGRRDVERNRALILDRARATLDADPDAPMHAFAKAAGVGQATLYRHFPTREALVLAVHREDVASLVALAPELLETRPPTLALRLWFDRLSQYGRIKHGLGGALYAATHARLAEEGYRPVVDAIGLLLDAGIADGSFRDDVGPEEVLLLVGFLWRLAPDEDRDAQAARLLDVVVAGLRGSGRAVISA
jgi:AcrR family transcriptional regulator